MHFRKIPQAAVWGVAEPLKGSLLGLTPLAVLPLPSLGPGSLPAQALNSVQHRNVQPKKLSK